MTRLRLTSTGDLVPVDQPRHRDAGRRTRSSAAHQKLRAQVLAEESACAQCGSATDPEMDHIVPISAGGAPLDRDNVRRLCGRCNRAKGPGFRVLVERHGW